MGRASRPAASTTSDLGNAQTPVAGPELAQGSRLWRRIAKAPAHQEPAEGLERQQQPAYG